MPPTTTSAVKQLGQASRSAVAVTLAVFAHGASHKLSYGHPLGRSLPGETRLVLVRQAEDGSRSC